MQLFTYYFHSLIELLNSMAPYLLLGFLFAGILKVWFPKRWIDRYMGQNNWRSAVNTALLGIPLPLCSCGVIPTGISFYRTGASKGSSISFLISTPQTGVDSVLVTYSLLGLPFAIIRVIVALITGVAGGIITNFTTHKEINAENKKSVSSTNSLGGNKFKEIFRYGFNEFLMDIAKWLIIGILIAALLDTLIPDDFFNAYLANEWLSMLVILAASVPLYICATASVPIAAVLMLKGLSPGAALVLLMAGPATNAATITVIKNVFGGKTLLAYLSSIIGGAFIFGTIINNFLPREWFTLFSDAKHLHHHELMPYWFHLTCTITLISLIIYGYLKKFQSKTKIVQTIKKTQNQSIVANASPMPADFSSFTVAKPLITQTYTVEGMTCSHCKNNVEQALLQLKGVNSVNANPDTNSVSIECESLMDNTIKVEVEKLGYLFKGKQ